MIIPRDYQIDCINAIDAYFETNSGNPICALPTGTGKALCLAMFMTKAFYNYPKQKMLVVTHVQELIVQNVKELLNLWPRAPVGINSSALKRRDFCNNIVFCGIASVCKDAEKFSKVDIVLVDECHLISQNDETMYRKFINELTKINPYLKVIGFSATPYRLGQGLLTDSGLFTDICYDLTGLHAFNQLIAKGYMSPLVPKKTNYELDISDVKLGQDGDYAKGQLQLAVDKYEVTVEALKEAVELGHDRNCWLIFASGIEHCEHISEILTDLDITNVVIHSRISNQERLERLELFKTAQVKAVIGFRVMTTGFNHPPVDLIVDLYPTTSPSMHVQKYGRGTRPYDHTNPRQYQSGFDYVKKDCLVLDFSGNTRRLGPINDPVMPRKKGESKGGQAPVKICEVCNCYNHTTVRICSYCGAEFVFKVKINTEAGTDKLIKDDFPVFEEFKIDHIIYAQHVKAGRKSLKVSYYSGLRVFNEFIGIEYTGYAKNKADLWWQERTGTKSPDSLLSAMYLTDSLKKPSHLKAITNKKYPEIHSFIFGEPEKAIKTETIEPELEPYDDLIPFESSTKQSFTDDEFPF